MTAYLNVDFASHFATSWDAVDAFAMHEPLEEVRAAAAEAHALVSRNLTDNALLHLLVDTYGLGYWPPAEGYAGNEWLTEVSHRLTAAAERRSADTA